MLYWRRDGKPLWHDPSLVALDGASRPAIINDAERFATTLADALGVDPDCALPTYEDPFPYIAREQSLPENVDPFDSKLEDPEEQARLARVFEHGLGNPTGWTLPIQRWNARDAGARWISERWSSRRGRLFLGAETRRSVSGCRSAPCLGCRLVSLLHARRSLRGAAAAARSAAAAAAAWRSSPAAGGPGEAAANRRVAVADRDRGRGSHRDLDRAARRQSLRVRAAFGER